jgi:hypothetical protein
VLRGEVFGISPLVLPGFLMTVAVSAVLVAPVSRRFRLQPVVVWILLMGLGGIASLTLTPHPGPLDSGSTGFCDLRFTGLLSWSQLFSNNDRSLNVALYVPLGIGLGLLPRSRLKRAAVGLAIGLPVAIEFTQGAVSLLNRACQLQDVVDNLSGLAIGFLAGTAILVVAQSDLIRRLRA